MDALLTIVSKVLVMMILILVGYFLKKKGMLTDVGTEQITNLLIRIVTPCLIVTSFINSRGLVNGTEMLMAAGIAVLGMAIGLGLSLISFGKETAARKTVLRFSVMFGNVGFMGVPLVQGIVGEKGVVYASFGVVAFNIITWTYGYRLMNSHAKLNWRTVLLNPGVIGLAAGIPLYFANFMLPPVAVEPLTLLSNLNTPLAMIVIGGYVAKVEKRAFVSDISVYQVSMLRLLAAPAVLLAVLLLLRPSPDLLMAGVVQGAMPVAANTVLFAVQYKKDSELASKAVAVSTVLSVLTIALFAVLTQYFIGLLY